VPLGSGFLRFAESDIHSFGIWVRRLPRTY